MILALEQTQRSVTVDEVQGGISPEETPVETLVRRSWPFLVIPYDPPTRMGPDRVRARVNHGRWIVECPACPGAQNASRTDHRFFCTEPLCPALGDRQWLKVIWPSDVDVARAEEILLGRPVFANRNWDPAKETLSQLAAENLAHAEEL